MKFDKKSLEALAAMPDDKLWSLVRVVSASAGIDLPSELPPPQKMRELRDAITSSRDMDIDRARRIAAAFGNDRGDRK